MSHTVGQTTTNYIWDVATGLPVVLQDGTNTYLYGLDLISATDGGGDQTYFTYDGLGSVADLTDDQGDEIDGYTVVNSADTDDDDDGTITHDKRAWGKWSSALDLSFEGDCIQKRMP